MERKSRSGVGQRGVDLQAEVVGHPGEEEHERAGVGQQAAAHVLDDVEGREQEEARSGGS